MYLAVVGAILGQALLLGRPVLLVYAVAVAAMWSRSCASTRSRPSPARYGAEYERYRRDVPGWWPSLTPSSAAWPSVIVKRPS